MRKMDTKTNDNVLHLSSVDALKFNFKLLSTRKVNFSVKSSLSTVYTRILKTGKKLRKLIKVSNNHCSINRMFSIVFKRKMF
jgi:hypothetical protein